MSLWHRLVCNGCIGFVIDRTEVVFLAVLVALAIDSILPLNAVLPDGSSGGFLLLLIFLLLLDPLHLLLVLLLILIAHM